MIYRKKKYEGGWFVTTSRGTLIGGTGQWLFGISVCDGVGGGKEYPHKMGQGLMFEHEFDALADFYLKKFKTEHASIYAKYAGQLTQDSLNEFISSMVHRTAASNTVTNVDTSTLHVVSNAGYRIGVDTFPGAGMSALQAARETGDMLRAQSDALRARQQAQLQAQQAHYGYYMAQETQGGLQWAMRQERVNVVERTIYEDRPRYDFSQEPIQPEIDVVMTVAQKMKAVLKAKAHNAKIKGQKFLKSWRPNYLLMASGLCLLTSLYCLMRAFVIMFIATFNG